MVMLALMLAIGAGGPPAGVRAVPAARVTRVRIGTAGRVPLTRVLSQSLEGG
jgi:hypothetical protein